MAEGRVFMLEIATGGLEGRRGFLGKGCGSGDETWFCSGRPRMNPACERVGMGTSTKLSGDRFRLPEAEASSAKGASSMT